jgi:glycosyltransferase involved in cell wall biosynthesis
MKRPTVVISVLCGSERTQWINPKLAACLLAAAADQRYRVVIDFVQDLRPWDFARNTAMDAARKLEADWNMMLDNDIIPSAPLIDIVAAMGDRRIAGAVYGQQAGAGYALAKGLELGVLGDFSKTTGVAGGMILAHREVWQRIPSPWFKFETQDDELRRPNIGEDIYFSRLARQHGFVLWAYRVPFAHLRTADITRFAMPGDIRHGVSRLE